MKIVAYIIPLLFLCSCEDFLEYKDKDKVIPNELTHYEELIYGEILTKNLGGTGRELELMTDDMGDEVPVPNYYTDDKRDLAHVPWYKWAVDPQVSEDGTETIDASWEYFYHGILMCNIVEDEVNALEDDLDGVKFRLLGEVQCMRAIFYWYLTGMYGAPYRDPEEAKTAMGVPINREVGIEDKLYERSTLQEVYDEMKTDLNEAIANFQKGDVKNTIFRPNEVVAKLFLSRIYLAEKNYEEVIAICNDALAATTARITGIDVIKTYTKWGDVNLYNVDNPGILFTWMNRWGWTTYFAGYSACFKPSKELMDLYRENPADVRLTTYFDSYDNTPIKKSYDETTYGMCYRVEEFYYNRAEAYIESGEYQLGLDDVNQVRYNRIDGADYKLTAANQEEARNAFRDEKRREFSFEDMRWYDMKRWGVRAVHRFHDFNNAEMYTEYVLEADSPNYILPLPLDIQRRNDIIEKTNRVDTQVN